LLAPEIPDLALLSVERSGADGRTRTADLLITKTAKTIETSCTYVSCAEKGCKGRHRAAPSTARGHIRPLSLSRVSQG
jgi:hypothetical protein